VKTAAIRLVTSLDGLSPETVALILAVGLVLGTFPVCGCPTLFCILAAVALRLNLPALQLVNHLTSPLQLALLVPFARLGARIVPSPPAAPAVWKLGTAALQAITGWFVLCLPLGILLYALLACLLRLRPGRVQHLVAPMRAATVRQPCPSLIAPMRAATLSSWPGNQAVHKAIVSWPRRYALRASGASIALRTDPSSFARRKGFFRKPRKWPDGPAC
jgi:uncharacterized protein (DUF2062 family)